MTFSSQAFNALIAALAAARRTEMSDLTDAMREYAQASRAPQPTDDDREALAREIHAAHQRRWCLNGDGEACPEARQIADAIAGFRRAPAEHDVEYVREGVCLLCGDGVLNSGEHLDPERHAEWVAKVTSAPAEPAVQAEPTDAQVEAAAMAWSSGSPTPNNWENMTSRLQGITKDRMRAALRAAFATRGADDEQRLVRGERVQRWRV